MENKHNSIIVTFPAKTIPLESTKLLFELVYYTYLLDYQFNDDLLPNCTPKRIFMTSVHKLFWPAEIRLSVGIFLVPTTDP